MNLIIDAALGHARTILASLTLVLICGSYAYLHIAKEAEPDINIPIIYVSMHHEGISPEDAERLLIRPMEKELRTIEGVRQIQSAGYEGGANVTLEFDAGFDADMAIDEVREKVDLTKHELPAETDEPEIHEVNFSLFPVIVVTLSGAVPERALLKLGRHLQDQIESLSEILRVQIAGDRPELVEILINPVKVESYGLAVTETINAVRSSNLLVAAGAQDTGLGRFSLKVPGLFETVTDIISMPVKVQGDAVVTLGDISTVRRSFKDPISFARVDGRRAIALEVSKRTGENIIDTVSKVRGLVFKEQKKWPEILHQSVEIAFTNDRSSKIRDMLSDLENSVIVAVLLVMIVVVWALGFRSAAMIGLAIPGSFLTGILVLGAVGLTINMVVLFALILAVGILVDGAIVVIEYADRKMREGEPPRASYSLASKRMAWPIIASTATTLAAFLPLMFWPGVVGEFMKFLPFTLIATLSASLLMALIFIPTLGATISRQRFSPGELSVGKEITTPERIGGKVVPGFTELYLRVLSGALDQPVKILVGSLFVLVSVQVLYANFGRGIEFFPKVEPDQVKLQVKARGNLATMEKDGLVREVEELVLDLNREKDEFSSVYTRTGREERSQEAEDIIGNVSLELSDWWARRNASDILEDILQKCANIAGVVVNARKLEAGPPMGKPVQIQLSSRYPKLLGDSVVKIRRGLAEIGGFRNFEDDRPLPGIDWELTVNRAQAAKFKANVDLIGRSVQMVTAGIKVGEYRPDNSDEEINIRVRYPRPYRTIGQLNQIRAETVFGAVPIGNFVEMRASPRVGTIKRFDGKRVMTVKADLAPGGLANDKIIEIQKWLNTADIDTRVDVTFKGESEEQEKAKSFLIKAFTIALFIMAVILVTQFNSFYSSFLILSAVVMSTTGVFIGLLITQQPFSIVMGGIGIIALAGIVVNNNIVLIDTFDRIRETEGDVRKAILKTGIQRLRPVLLTTITTILGLMPMVLGINIDFVERSVSIGAPATQWWRQLATAIVFGLGFATVLTLVITPSALMLRDNVRAWFYRQRHAQSASNN
ncbi:MAG: MFS transporter [Rhodospirillaceae bacterium TMED8]|nr:MFS transporter [Magnetovibrio sp.]OUT50767.1 MAG: MFS transporter [Rhodospirillaceae bacterium TMED8]